MEPNKLDSIIKEKIEERTIQPSAQAWGRLDAMLAVAEKPKRSNSWMYIAASFVGLLIVSSIFFNQKEKIIRLPAVKVVVKEVMVPETILKPKNNGGIAVTNMNSSPANRVAVSNTTSILKGKSIINNTNQNSIDQVSIINQKTESNSIAIQTNDVSVDELLAAAGKSPANENQLNNKQLVHVNVTNLLSQVDGELELSFREKVINKVSKNYQSVKAALVNRNFK